MHYHLQMTEPLTWKAVLGDSPIAGRPGFGVRPAWSGAHLNAITGVRIAHFTFFFFLPSLALPRYEERSLSELREDGYGILCNSDRMFYQAI